MQISEILRGKPKNTVHSIKSATTLKEAIAALSRHGIGALLVIDDEAVLGIISERDVIQAQARRGFEALSQTVGDVMTRAVTTCAPTDSAEDALRLMTAGRFRHLPVMADGALQGLVSIGDVVKARLNEVEYENAAMMELIAGH